MEYDGNRNFDSPYSASFKGGDEVHKSSEECTWNNVGKFLK
jgi:hypothetical protein